MRTNLPWQWDRHGRVIETIVRSEENGGVSASELIPIAMEKFQIRVEPFAKLLSSLGNSAQRYSLLSVLADEMPGIELTHSFLELVAEIGGTFQIDLSIGPMSDFVAPQ